MKTLFIFPFLPFRGARALRAHPRWLVPFLALASLHIALLIFSERETVNSVIAHLPPGATAADREEVGSMLNATRLTHYMFEPVRLLAGWSAFAAILYLFIRSLSPPGPVTFVRVLSLEVHAEAALVIGGIATAVYATIVQTGGGGDMQIPLLSAAPLLPATSPYPLVALLATLNIFTLWYVVLLATGMRVLFGMTVRTAALVAVSAWALSVLFDTAILTLLVTTLHLRV
jgi:hypothetical protein